MLVERWLASKVGFNIKDDSVESILEDRGVTLESESADMTEKQRDLCRADALVIYLSSSNKGSESKNDGNSSYGSASESFTYRDNAQEMAIFWFEKWGEVSPYTSNDKIYDKSDMW